MAGLGKKRAMELFGATLKNVRWSWGGPRADGSIVFIGWKDEAVLGDKGSVVSCRLAKSLGPQDDLGAIERVQQVEAALASGGTAFLALAIAKDPGASPREVDAVLPVLYRIRLEPRDAEVHGVVTGVEPLVAPE